MIHMAQIKLTDQEIDAAVRVLKSGALRQGKECQAFEQAFAEKGGAGYAVTCANGSAALHLAYMACLSPGDEVLVPSFTFFATGSMVTLTGGKPVFCDIDSETFLIDLNDAKKKVTPKTKAIAPVHLFGNPCDIAKIQEFARTHGLTVIWDAAQAHGAVYEDKDVSAFDDFVCYSFYPSKNMFVGEGGMVCTNNETYDHKLRYTRTHGQTGKYLHTMLGTNYRMTDVEAAIGREQLKRLDDMLVVRRRNAAMMNEAFSSVPGVYPQKITDRGVSAWHQYCVRIEPDEYGCHRDILMDRLKQNGVATGIHYPRGIHQQPIFETLYGRTTLPNTEYLADNILALPVHHGLTENDVDLIVQSVKDSRK